MENIEVKTKFSKLKNISSTDWMEDNYSFTLVVCFFSSVSLSLFIVKKMFIEIGFKEA